MSLTDKNNDMQQPLGTLLKKARHFLKSKNFSAAIETYLLAQKKFPGNKTVINDFQSKLSKIRRKMQIEPPPEEIQKTLKLLNSGKTLESLEVARALEKKYPFSSFLQNIQGVAQTALMKENEAIGYFEKSKLLNPKNHETLNAISVSQVSVGRISEAQSNLKRALLIKPDFRAATENLTALLTQISPTHLGYEPTLNAKIIGPRFLICMAITKLILGDTLSSQQYLELFIDIPDTDLSNLTHKNRTFCTAYNKFLTNLLPTLPTVSKDLPIMYFVGDSHTLSYANQQIIYNAEEWKISPKISFGLKAFHLSTSENNEQKAVTAANLASLPRGSIVLISVGEIDCRANEGFLQAAKKKQMGLEKLVDRTVNGMLDWISEVNSVLNHDITFQNVPAPVYDKHLSDTLNHQVKKCILLYNNLIADRAASLGLRVLDVYRYTVDKSGFSNERYHIDGVHLNPALLTLVSRS